MFLLEEAFDNDTIKVEPTSVLPEGNLKKELGSSSRNGNFFIFSCHESFCLASQEQLFSSLATKFLFLLPSTYFVFFDPGLRDFPFLEALLAFFYFYL